jgi:3',5'-cyclic AMP phosphodiesterase CpdA
VNEVDGAVTIAHVSDMHLGAHSDDAVRDLITDVAAARPTVTVVTGDCTMRALTGQFRRARAVLDGLPRPLLVVIGNHDVPLRNPVRRLLRPYVGYRSWIADELDPVLDLTGVRVQGLGSAPPWRWKAGRVTRRQADLLVASLAGAPPAVLRVVALHHPLSQRGPGGLIGRARLLAGLARAGVELVLAGHTHLPAAERAGGAGGGHSFVEVVAGTATSTRTRGTGRSWTLIRAEPDWITVEHRRHDDAGWHGGPQTRFRRS